jgi:hypothetical protein
MANPAVVVAEIAAIDCMPAASSRDRERARVKQLKRINDNN